MVIDMYQDILNILASDDYYQIKKDIYKLINDNDFIKTITVVHNPIVFDRFIKMCEYKTDTSILYEERNKFIRKTILNLNKDNIYDFFELNSLDKSRQEIIANRYLIEYIVNYYFGDNYYNFMTNFYQMLSYLECSKKDLVNRENIMLYKEFVNLRHMSFIDKIGFFKLLLDDVNVKEKFYDDINMVREDSHKELVNRTLKLTKDNGIYQPDLSRRFMVDTYYLDGEEFFGFVRCLMFRSEDLLNKEDYVFSKKGHLGYSFSYISNHNIGTIDYEQKNVTLFYSDIDYRNIMYVHHGDLHSKKMNVQDDYLSNKENEIIQPERLIGKTNNYNEIYIKSGKNGIKPTALVCYDKITNHDIDFAKKYNLALLIINSQKYRRYERYDDDYDDYSYVI